MTGPDEQLLTTTEGVDEGSAASTAEGPGSGGQPSGGTVTAPAEAPAAPDDVESAESRATRGSTASGQQLQAGEG